MKSSRWILSSNVSITAIAIALMSFSFYGCSDTPQPQKGSPQVDTPEVVYDSMQETNENLTQENESSGQEHEGNQEEGDSVNGSVGGGDYSHLQNMSGTVTAISETSITIVEARGPNATNYTIDTRTAKQHGRLISDIDVGTEVTVDYFLYDKEGSAILAQAVYRAYR